MTMTDALAARLGDIPMQTGERAVRAKSRDFFWYSPVLKDRLDHVAADAVVSPRTEAQVMQVLSACYDLDIPVTPRGGGTGNYGQSMPIAGGVVLDMTGINRILAVDQGRIVVEPGALMGDIEDYTRAEYGLEFRMHPSTRETATIGGFISGGSGGVGSIRWGFLADPGNILRVRMATMEATPRLIDLTGADIAKVHHAYGLTGVMTEVEMPLAPAEDWVELVVGFDDWGAALSACWDLAGQDGLLLKQLAAIEAPAPSRYFKRHAKFIRDNEHVLAILVAPNSLSPLLGLLAAAGGRVAFNSATASAEDKKGLPHLHHLCWNHTTLRALKTDPEITYLQIGFPDGAVVETCLKITDRFAGEIINHVEFTRSSGRKRASALPMVRFSNKTRLDALIAELDAMGCPNWNPHAYTYEEGNHADAAADLVALKRDHDPKGLLNPGKLIGWHDPGYRYDPKGDWAYPGLIEPAAE
ncbi:MAG: FAD-binding oxidoreductase [Pseudomonadota bacterium]